MQKVKLLLFIIILFSYAYFQSHSDVNTNSRLNLVCSLLNFKSTQIDAYHFNTIDKSYYNGHFYSDKAIGTSITALPVGYIYKLITKSAAPEHSLFTYLLVLFTISLPSALSALIFFEILLLFGIQVKTAFLFTLSCFLGTIIFPYSTTFYGHQLTSVLCLCGFYLAFIQRHKTDIKAQRHKIDCRLSIVDCRLSIENSNNQQPTTNNRFQMSNNLQSKCVYFLCGLFLSYAVVTEFTSVIIFLAIIIYIIFQITAFKGNASQYSSFNFPRWNALFYLLLGVLPSVILLFTYNYISFGKMLTIGYFHESDTYFKHKMSAGFGGIGFPNLTSLYAITFSPRRGLFFQSPFLIFSFWGFFYMLKDRKYRIEGIICLFIVVCFLALNSSYYMPEGGFATGPRHLLPALPFLMLPIAFIIKTMNEKVKLLFYAFCCLSITYIFVAVSTFPHISPSVDSPLFEVFIPLLKSGVVAKNIGYTLGLIGIASLLPIIIIIAFLVILSAVSNPQSAVSNRKSKIENRKSPVGSWQSEPQTREQGFKDSRVQDTEEITNYKLQNRKSKIIKSKIPSPQTAIPKSPNIFLFILYIVITFLVVMAIDYSHLVKYKDNHKVDKHRFLARIFKEAGKTEETRKELESVLNEPDSALAHIDIGNLYFQLHQPEKAIQHFEYAIQIVPNVFEVHLNLGLVYTYTGRLDKAIEIFEKASKLFLKNSNQPTYKLFYQLGKLYYKKGDLEKAKNNFLRAIDLNKHFSEAYTGLAMIETETKKQTN